VLIDASWLQNADAMASIMEIPQGAQLVAAIVKTMGLTGGLIGTKGSHTLADQAAEVANDWASRLLGWHMETCWLQLAPSGAAAAEWLRRVEARKGEILEEVPELDQLLDFGGSPLGFDAPSQRL